MPWCARKQWCCRGLLSSVRGLQVYALTLLNQLGCALDDTLFEEMLDALPDPEEGADFLKTKGCECASFGARCRYVSDAIGGSYASTVRRHRSLPLANFCASHPVAVTRTEPSVDLYASKLAALGVGRPNTYAISAT